MFKRNTQASSDRTNTQHQISRRVQAVAVIGLLGLLLIVALPGIASAAIAVINTNDAAWDANWGTPMFVDTNVGPAGYDIDTFWVNTNAAAPTVYYFGLTSVGPLDPNAIVYFFVDCNDNGAFTDLADRVLEYDPFNDWVTEYSGDEALIELGPVADPNGEVIGGNSVEAQTNNTGTVDWAACQLGNHSMKAEIWNDIITNAAGTGPSQSATTPVVLDLPTAVSLTSFATNINEAWPVYVALMGLVLLGLAAWTWHSFTGRKNS